MCQISKIKRTDCIYQHFPIYLKHMCPRCASAHSTRQHLMITWDLLEIAKCSRLYCRQSRVSLWKLLRAARQRRSD